MGGGMQFNSGSIGPSAARDNTETKNCRIA